ncbi:hypothetical protein C1H46_005595 [Malus baccata]|uniref:Uncharacterized protein n=1 Tax=Malus baccata TaxID=106549 RepID=A0A540NCI6_MALBA|nr:hypothetical protein C1H46_005595 [Malus baccata]
MSSSISSKTWHEQHLLSAFMVTKSSEGMRLRIGPYSRVQRRGWFWSRELRKLRMEVGFVWVAACGWMWSEVMAGVARGGHECGSEEIEGE